MTDERYIYITEEALHDFEGHDYRRQPGDKIIERLEHSPTPIPPRKRPEVSRFESDFKSARRPAAHERTRVAATEAAEALAEINKEAATAIVKASGLPPEDKPEDEPEQPIPEPDPEEPLPVPPNLDPGIVAVASHPVRSCMFRVRLYRGAANAQTLKHPAIPVTAASIDRARASLLPLAYERVAGMASVPASFEIRRT